MLDKKTLKFESTLPGVASGGPHLNIFWGLVLLWGRFGDFININAWIQPVRIEQRLLSMGHPWKGLVCGLCSYAKCKYVFLSERVHQ